MYRPLRRLLMATLMLLAAAGLSAQNVKTHKVKKNETMYGIARDNGITVEQLVAANPGMEQPGYVLKKGKVINIPILTTGQRTANGDPNGDIRQRPIRLGVMLPLHNQNGDGQRMVEYYRGVLMACDTLRREGISVDVYAWNTPQDADLTATLNDPNAARCDIIIGPLYSRQVSRLSDFATRHNALLLIPFSIEAPELYFNRSIFQVYQSPGDLQETTARRFAEGFRDSHPVIIDCADPASTKGGFTSTLRRQLEVHGVAYSLTSLQSTDANFGAAFTLSKPNIVVLNTARLTDLKAAFTRVEQFMQANPTMRVSFVGYEEWMAAEQQLSAQFHRYDMYLPAPFFTNIYSSDTEVLQLRYRANFGEPMQNNFPRFALTGYDQTLFFMRGLHQYGSTFDGAQGRLSYRPVQTPLKFERIGNGGRQNRAFLFVHYKTDGSIETINY